jgi:Dolichyl-phosphate-mannose-protein mannosyltransferase
LKKPRPERGRINTLAAIALLSLALDLAGITWGLPARWQPDEKSDAVARMARAGSLAPDSFINPSLPLYAQWPVLWVQARAADAGWLQGVAADPLVVGRALSALAGALAVYILGLAGMRIERGLGLLAAALLAIAPGVVNLCHFATPEPWLLLGAAGTLLCALDHLAGRRSAALLGLVLGLTAGTKYTAAALVVPCLVAVWLQPSRDDSPRRPWRAFATAGALALIAGIVLASALGASLAARLHLPDARLLRPEHAEGFVRSMAIACLVAGLALSALAVGARQRKPWALRLARTEVLVLAGAAALAFAIATPFALVRPRAFLSDLAFNQQTRHEYKGLVGASTSLGPYLGLLVDALTGPVAAAAGLGALVALGRAVRKDAAALVLLAAAISPYLLVASSGHRAMRFLVPALPAAVALAALALRAVPAPRVRAPLIALVLARTALGAALVLRLFFVDSRLLAARWIEANVPARDAIDLIANNPGYGPALPPGRLRIVPTLSREMAPADRFREAAAAYPRAAAPWVVLPAAYYERFLDHPDQTPERAAFFRDLLEGRAGFEVAARFRQPGWRRPPAEFLDPEIVVLRKTTAAGAQPPTR